MNQQDLLVCDERVWNRLWILHLRVALPQSIEAGGLSKRSRRIRLADDKGRETEEWRGRVCWSIYLVEQVCWRRSFEMLRLKERFVDIQNKFMQRAFLVTGSRTETSSFKWTRLWRWSSIRNGERWTQRYRRWAGIRAGRRIDVHRLRMARDERDKLSIWSSMKNCKRHSIIPISGFFLFGGIRKKGVGGGGWNSYHWDSSHQICFDNAILVLHVLITSAIFIDACSKEMNKDRISAVIHSGSTLFVNASMKIISYERKKLASRVWHASINRRPPIVPPPIEMFPTRILLVFLCVSADLAERSASSGCAVSKWSSVTNGSSYLPANSSKSNNDWVFQRQTQAPWRERKRKTIEKESTTWHVGIQVCCLYVYTRIKHMFWSVLIESRSLQITHVAGEE